jgi:membrane protein implicated in regulation of membrane protease activity
VFGSLLLAGPFAMAVVLVVAMALAAVSVALLAAAVVAIVATPNVLVRRTRRYWASHPFQLVGHRARATRAMAVPRVDLDAAASVVMREPVA